MPIKKVGLARIRAIEQLKILFSALAAQGNIKDSEVLGDVLRRRVIDSVLSMIRSFPFCSISHQQSIHILNLLKDCFDQEDLSTLQNFVKTELGGDTNFKFLSGSKTSGMNIGQIVQIAIDVRNMI